MPPDDAMMAIEAILRSRSLSAANPNLAPDSGQSGLSPNPVIRLAPEIVHQQSVGMTSDETTAKITKVVEHAPEWLRQDLTAKDLAVRERAEERLAAMIAAALKASGDHSAG